MQKEITNKINKKRRAKASVERGIDEADTRKLVDEEDQDEVQPSDMFELRTCGNVPDCEALLPLDQPGHYVRIHGRKTLVCDSCFEFINIFGDYEHEQADVDDEDY